MLRACGSVVLVRGYLLFSASFAVSATHFHLMGRPEGATLGPWDGHRIGVKAGDPSCHQGVLGPCREGHGAYEEPGVLVQEDLGSQESGLEESGCLGFGPEHPFGYSWRRVL